MRAEAIIRIRYGSYQFNKEKRKDEKESDNGMDAFLIGVFMRPRGERRKAE